MDFIFGAATRLAALSIDSRAARLTRRNRTFHRRSLSAGEAPEKRCASICSFMRLLSSSVIDRPCIGPSDARSSCAAIANGFVLIVEIVPEHVFWILRRAYWLGGYRRHFAEIVDLPRENQGVIELWLGVDFELSGDVHVLCGREHLGIDYVGDDGLVFAGKVFVQQLREPVAGISSSFAADWDSAIPQNFDRRRNRQVRRLCATENAIDGRTAAHSALAIQPEGFSAS
jgi:hypothetical protein